MKRLYIVVAVIIGIGLLVAAGMYFVTPAEKLPMFFPGYQAGLMKRHITHGVGTLVVSLALFVFAWFQSGKKSTK